MSAKHHRNLPTTFLTQLPFDILNKIFSQLKQRDCIACVGVCHEWYNHVPQYITHIWESVTLSQRHLDAVLDASHSKSTMCCLKRCLGSHVKHVELVGFEYELDLYWMMQNLIDWSCDQIQTLALNNCVTKDQVAFIQQLHQLASNDNNDTRLTHLSLKNHRSNVAFFNVLSACPALTHFTYKPADSAVLVAAIHNQEPHVDETLIMMSDNSSTRSGSGSEAVCEQQPRSSTKVTAPRSATFDHLIYLHIDVLLNAPLRLEPILEKCPNLRCFIGASKRMASLYEHHMTNFDTSVHLSDLLWYCPKIVSYVGNCTYNDDDSDPSIIMLLQQENHPHTITSLEQNSGGSDIKDEEKEEAGFQNLCISDFPYYDYTIQHLRSRNQQRIIQYLHLTQYRTDTDSNNNNSVRQSPITNWSSLFRSLQTMPQLHTFICDHIRFDTHSFITLLNACPTIQNLHIHRLLHRLNQRTLFQASSSARSSSVQLQTLPSLRKLCLKRVSFVKTRLHYDDPEKISLAPLLARMPRLETLIMSNRTIMTLSGGSDHPGYFEPLRNLKYLEISLSQWPSLNTPPIITSGLFHYLSHHQQQQSNSPSQSLSSNNNNALSTIKLDRINFTTELLMAIAHVPTLKDLFLAGCYPFGYNDDIDSNGHGSSSSSSDRVVRTFLSTLGATAKALQRLRFGPITYLSHDTLATLNGESFPCLQKMTFLPWTKVSVPPTLVPNISPEKPWILPTRVSKHGLITLLQNSSSKTFQMVMFAAATLVLDDDDDEKDGQATSSSSSSRSFSGQHVKRKLYINPKTLLHKRKHLHFRFSVFCYDVRKFAKFFINGNYDGDFSEMESIIIKRRRL